MGRGMVTNFLKNNYEVFVWNRTRSVSESIDGAIVCNSPKEVAQKADIIFEITANDESSQEVWTSKDGILAGADDSKILILSATVSIDWVDKLIALCDKDGLRLLDIPLTGGRIGAETGNLTLLCGGDESLVEELKPTFEAIAGNVLYFGPSGQGMRYKLILNYLQGAHIVAFGQAMQIAKATNMDLKKVADALAQRPGGTSSQSAKDAYFQDPDPVTFSIEWIAKDVSYAEEFAKSVGLDLSVLKATLDEYKKVLEEHKDEDWASVNKILSEQDF